MNLKLDSVVTAALVVCALVTTSLVVHREVFVLPTAPTKEPPLKPRFVQNWKSQLAHGVQLGPMDAPVQLIEFADFECPFCASFHSVLKTLRDHYPGEVSITFVHFPLPGHRFAIPAARVAECANEQGRFEAMYDQLFDAQDSFGLRSWSEYATAAGVPDLAIFDACIKKTNPIPRVVEGQALGREVDVQGTPTLIVNGWKLGNPPTEKELEDMVRAVLAGKEPVSGAGKS